MVMFSAYNTKMKILGQIKVIKNYTLRVLLVSVALYSVGISKSSAGFEDLWSSNFEILEIIVSSENNGEFTAKDGMDSIAALVSVCGTIQELIDGGGPLSSSLSNSAALYSLGNNLYDLGVGLKELKVARDNNESDLAARGKILSSLSSAALDATSIASTVSEKLKLNPVYSISISVTKINVEIADIATDTYGDARRDAATQIASSMMLLKDSTINKIKNEINEITEEYYDTDKPIVLEEIESRIYNIAKESLEVMNKEPYINYSPSKAGVGWGFSDFFTGNIEYKTYNDVYSYFLEIVLGNHKLFNVNAVAQMALNAKYIKATEANRNLQSQVAIVERSMPSSQEEGPIDNPVIGDNEDVTDEDKGDLGDQPPLPVADIRYRGFIAGTVGHGALFTTDARTLDYGKTVLRSGANAIETNDGAVTINVNADFGGYSYTAWGRWEADDVSGTLPFYPGSSLEKGHWVIGRVTSPAEFQHRVDNRSGAHYEGRLAGTSFQGGTVGGVISLDANLANRMMGGTLNFTHNGSAWVNGSLLPTSIDVGSNRVTFRGDLSINGGGEGGLDGIFFGPNAEETGGAWAIWNVPDSIGGADGVFRAKE